MLSGMIKLASGSIVNVSSQASLVGLAGHISYASSKGGRWNDTGFRIELGKYNIRVNAVNPTVVMTPMSEWYWGREDGGPLGGYASPVGQSRGLCSTYCLPSIGCISNDFRRGLSIDGGFTAV